MLFYIAELSKYILALLIILYSVDCLYYIFKMKNPYDCNGIYIRQRISIFLINSVAFTTMCLRSGKYEYLLYGAILILVLYFFMAMTVLLYPRTDQCLVNNMVLLLDIGFIILARLSQNRGIKQFFIVIVSLAIAMVVPYLIKRLDGLNSLSPVYATLGIVVLGVVLMLGKITNGSKLSYTIAGFTIQPSEFVKIVFVFFVAASLSKAKSFIDYALGACVAALHVIILVLSKDLGSALIFFMAYLIMLFITSKNYLFLFAGLLSGAAASVVAYRLFPHVRVRVQAFMDPFSKIDDQGYQISQSLFAISCGNFFGTGLMKGAPGDIPTVESDFIFSAISEEMGVIFSIGMLAVCLFTFAIILKNSLRESNKFTRTVSIGLGTIMIVQTFLTVGGGIKFIPLTGVTLPLVSYGGSSVLSSILMYYTLFGIINKKRSIDYDNWFDTLEDDDEDDIYAYMEYIDEQNRLEKEELNKKMTKGNRRRKSGVRPLETRIIFYSFAALFFSMSAYLCYYVSTHEIELINNSYNSRQTLLAKENIRGKIYDRDGEILAQTLTNDKGKEYRDYPFENLFSHAVGYSTKGKTGIESMANYYLINTDASIAQKVENDISGKKNFGNDIYTTFDKDIQDIAFRSMGIYKGAIIVSDIKTGNILAMVSKPDFDPNNIVADWDKFMEDKESGTLINRATQGIYPPGSTFKIITALEYIKENPTNYMDYRYNCTGSYKGDGIKINCFHGAVHGSQNFLTSFAHSCNSSFANIGMSLDRDSFGQTLDDLMFNENLPVSYNYTVSNMHIDHTTGDYDMAQMSIGQGKAQITPLLLNMITNAIANDGMVMEPKVLDRAVSCQKDVIKTWESKEYKQIMTPEQAAAMKNLMEAVVKEGTAKAGMKGANYSAAGKTGSAEFDSLKLDSHAWFTGFAPVDDPQVSVTIIIESIGTGGDYAVPIAKRIFDCYFDEY
ncbi:MAG: FtsW/RodA/SpoVE family cell cycle protein [Lachnospiraceae bacterium]|nr:FtsW/RodA/SpoVE family cell cycle protein [Lachnospiraceae bacterium]